MAPEVFPDDWHHKIHIVSDGTYVDTNLIALPSLIDENQVNAHFWANVQANGADIRCTTDAEGTNEIPVEVVKCDTSGEKLVLFIKRDISSAGGDDVFIWYNTDHTSFFPLPGDTYGSEAVWTGYEAVYHLEEGSRYAGDATGNGHHGVYITTPPSPRNPDGQVGQANEFDGALNYIDIGDLGNHDNVTIECWFNQDTQGASKGLFSRGAWGNGTVHFKMSTDLLTTGVFGSGNAQSGSLSTGQWYHTAYTYQINSQVELFLSGASIATTPALNYQWDGSSKMEIAHEYTGYSSGDRYFDGKIDEARFATDIKSDEWIKISYYNQLLSTNLWKASSSTPIISSNGIHSGIMGSLIING